MVILTHAAEPPAAAVIKAARAVDAVAALVADGTVLRQRARDFRTIAALVSGYEEHGLRSAPDELIAEGGVAVARLEPIFREVDQVLTEVDLGGEIVPALHREATRRAANQSSDHR